MAGATLDKPDRVLRVFTDVPYIRTMLDKAADWWNRATPGADIIQVVQSEEEANTVVVTTDRWNREFQGQYKPHGRDPDHPSIIKLTPEAMLQLGPTVNTDTTRSGFGGWNSSRYYRERPMQTSTVREPVEIYVAGGPHPEVLGAALRAVDEWNAAVGVQVVKMVPDKTPGAVPIRLATQGNQWYAGSFAPDEEAEFTGLTGKGGRIQGTRGALTDELNQTLAHEIGHALGLYHPFPTTTPGHYVPATFNRYDPKDPSTWRVAPVGIMGNEMDPNDPNFRGAGPSEGEIAFLQDRFGILPAFPLNRPGPYDTTVLAHELGHAFGLSHQVDGIMNGTSIQPSQHEHTLVQRAVGYHVNGVLGHQATQAYVRFVNKSERYRAELHARKMPQVNTPTETRTIMVAPDPPQQPSAKPEDEARRARANAL